MASKPSPAAIAVGSALLAFAARRALLVGAALAPRLPTPALDRLPSVALVVPARNEEASLPRLLAALDRLDYPELTIVVADDGSTDGTSALLAAWTDSRERTTVLVLPAGGKAAALNAGLAAAPAAEVVVVCDADLEPAPGSLRELVRPLADPAVGAVAGYRRPANAAASPVARYAAVESWVKQLVTSAGRDRLGLDPPMIGWAAFRRSALEQIGGFDPDVWGEDVAATAALVQRGWHTRFAPDAIAAERVVADLDGYRRQHERWQASERDAGHAGYADRVVLVAALGLAARRDLPLRLPLGYLALRGLEVVVALRKAGAQRDAAMHLLWTAAFLPVDVAASADALMRSGRRRSGVWESPAREAADV